MSQYTIQFLVAGLAALVPSNSGDEITILVPKVEQEIVQGHCIPKHHTYLGYYLNNGQQTCQPGSTEVHLPGNKEKLCWFELTNHVVHLPSSVERASDPKGRDNFLFFYDENPDSHDVGDLTDFLWVTPLRNSSELVLETSLLDRSSPRARKELSALVEQFGFRTKSTCRFASRYNSHDEVFEIGTYGFGEIGSGKKLRDIQALANATMFDIATDDPKVEIKPFDPNAESVVLNLGESIYQDADGRVQLAIVSVVSDLDLLEMYIYQILFGHDPAADYHFMIYTRLQDDARRGGKDLIPFRTGHRVSRFHSRELESACSSPFLRPPNECVTNEEHKVTERAVDGLRERAGCLSQFDPQGILSTLTTAPQSAKDSGEPPAPEDLWACMTDSAGLPMGVPIRAPGTGLLARSGPPLCGQRKARFGE